MKTLLSLAAAGIAITTSAQAQDRYLGEIFLFGSNFCPRGTASAEGQLLPISQNSALFSLYGTMYGGDGRTSFGLPDLRGRTPVGVGNGPGLTSIRQGQKMGAESVSVSGGGGSGQAMDIGAIDPNALVNNAPGFKKVRVSGQTVTTASGGGNNRSPQLGMRYCVVLQGIYPSRS